MKKILFFLTCVLLIVGCNKNDSLKDLNGNVKDTFKINETAVYKKIEYTITNFSIKEDKDEITEEDIVVATVTYKIKNTNSKAIRLYSSGLFYEDDNEINEVSLGMDYTELFSNDNSMLEPQKTYIVEAKYKISNKNSKFRYLMVIDDPEAKSIQMKVELN